MKTLWQHKIRVVIFLLIIYIGVVLWPVKFLLLPRFWMDDTLILFFNENEARPCGGFVTAYGEVQVFPPKFSMKNSFAITDDFGAAVFPISKISSTKNFWDLGTSSNLEVCALNFKYNYQKATGKEVKNVIFVDFGTVEKVVALFGELEVDGTVLTRETFFATVSRAVSNVDRHDEVTLQNRKKPLTAIGKKIIFNSIWRIDLWPKLTSVFREGVGTGNVFVLDISPRYEQAESDFSLIEWNLGGGKSSRFLRKKVQISAREVAPDEWNIDFGFSAENTGGADEPVSQDWLGDFEVVFPKFLKTKPVFLSEKIKTGEVFEWERSFVYYGQLPYFSLFQPRGQEVLADVHVALFPQQRLEFDSEIVDERFDQHENVGTFWGKFKGQRQYFIWEVKDDNVAPFVVLHEKISCPEVDDDLEEGEVAPNFCVEVHFNEEVHFKNFKASLTDRDYTAKDINENPHFSSSRILLDNRTAVLKFVVENSQPEERFYLQLAGVEDFFGNKVEEEKWTIVER